MKNISGFFNYFADSGISVTLTIMVMAVLLVFVVLLMYIPTLARKIFPKFGYAKYSNYLPFNKVYDDNSMSLTNGGFVRVFKVTGLQTSMQDDKVKEKFLDLRAQLFNQIKDSGVFLRFYTVRDAAKENTDYEFNQPVLQKIYNKWRGQGLKIFFNNHYIVLEVVGNNAHEKLNKYTNYIESVLAAYKPQV